MKVTNEKRTCFKSSQDFTALLKGEGDYEKYNIWDKTESYEERLKIVTNEKYKGLVKYLLSSHDDKIEFRITYDQYFELTILVKKAD